jgi:uncharacterized protein YuzE
MEGGRRNMQVLYNSKTDLLYLRLDDRKQQVTNSRLSEDIVLDLGEDDRIVGIEFSTLPSTSTSANYSVCNTKSRVKLRSPGPATAGSAGAGVKLGATPSGKE